MSNDMDALGAEFLQLNLNFLDKHGIGLADGSTFTAVLLTNLLKKLKKEKEVGEVLAKVILGVVYKEISEDFHENE